MTHNRKLRILCLHGMGQNSVLFRKKSAALFRGSEDLVETVYINGPHAVLDPEYPSIGDRNNTAREDVSEELRPYCWWFSDSHIPSTEDGYFYGFKESIAYLSSVFSDQGPFDGVFGFSQGACLAAIVAHFLEHPSSSMDLLSRLTHPPLQFVILAGGFIPTQKSMQGHLFSPMGLDTPSLHLIGQVDTVIAPERMEALVRTFKNPSVYRHPGGHFVPSTTPARKYMHQFLQHIQKKS